jgi:hypothetical protein
MTVSDYIDHLIPAEHRDNYKTNARNNGVPLGGQLLNLRLDKVYELAQILDVDAADLVVNIHDFENQLR